MNVQKYFGQFFGDGLKKSLKLLSELIKSFKRVLQKSESLKLLKLRNIENPLPGKEVSKLLGQIVDYLESTALVWCGWECLFITI